MSDQIDIEQAIEDIIEEANNNSKDSEDSKVEVEEVKKKRGRPKKSVQEDYAPKDQLEVIIESVEPLVKELTDISGYRYIIDRENRNIELHGGPFIHQICNLDQNPKAIIAWAKVFNNKVN